MHGPLKLPDPLRGSDVGSFAEHTVRSRLPDILRRTMAENASDAPTAAALAELEREIPDGTIRALLDTEAPDWQLWDRAIAPHVGGTWLTVPWFFTEAYFYRRIIEATRFFARDATARVDPFANQKQRVLEQSADALLSLGGRFESWLREPEYRSEGGFRVALHQALELSLWGNQADLSLWPGADGPKPLDHTQARAAEPWLANDSMAAVEHLVATEAATEARTVSFVLDNAGFELATDLAWVALLLERRPTLKIRLHLKAHPTFVSDATEADLALLLAHLSESSATQSWSRHLDEAVASGRLTTQTHIFWTSPLPFWELPRDLEDELRASALVIFKGDANYRRLVGDLHWPHATPLSEILWDAPTPVLAVRTSKSEVAVGLDASRVAHARQVDPDWLVNGTWGMIQYAAPPTRH